MTDHLSNSYDLLIVDRNMVDRSRIERSVAVNFWKIVHAETCEQAVELCRQQKFSVIIIEAEPHDTDIIPSLRAMRQSEGLSHAATIIAMSTFESGSFDVLLTQSGADTYVTKPIHEKDLPSIIKKVSKNRAKAQKTEHLIFGKD